MSRTGRGIKKAHVKVGLTFTILRDTGNLTGEYCIVKQNRQVTKPFIREFFQDARFSYDSVISAGDVILTSDGRHMIVMNLTPTVLKDETIEYEAVLYKCNVSGELKRYSGEETWDDNYNLQTPLVTVRETCYALLTEALFGNDLEADEELGLLGLKNNELYIPSSYGIEVHDRYQIVSGEEYYKVDTVSHRKYEDVDIAMLGEDNR